MGSRASLKRADHPCQAILYGQVFDENQSLSFFAAIPHHRPGPDNAPGSDFGAIYQKHALGQLDAPVERLT